MTEKANVAPSIYYTHLQKGTGWGKSICQSSSLQSLESHGGSLLEHISEHVGENKVTGNSVA